MGKFIQRLLLFTSVVALIIYLLNSNLPVNYRQPYAWYLLLFFFVNTIIIHSMLEKASEKSPQAFVRFYMGLTMMKMLFYLLILAGFMVFNKEKATLFVIWFFLMYIAYTWFEIKMIFNQLRSKK